MAGSAATATSRSADASTPDARSTAPVRTAPTRVETPAYMGGGEAARSDTPRSEGRDTSSDAPTRAAAPARDAAAPVGRDTSTPPVRETPPRGVTSTASGGESSPASGVASAAFAAALEQGAYFLNLGPGFTISAEELAATVNLANKPQILPGFRLIQMRFAHRNHGPTGNASVTIDADITIPHVRKRGGGHVRLTIDQNGTPTFNETLVSDLPIFKNKSLRVSLDDQRQLAAELVIESTDMMPATSIPNLTITGGGSFLLTAGKLQGAVQADLAYAKLGSGHFNFNFTSEGQASGDGTFNFEPGFLHGATATMEIDEAANLNARVDVPISDINTPIPGLSVTAGTITFTMQNGTPGGSLAGVKLVYNGLAEATIDADIRRGYFSGGGNFAVTVSELTDVTGRVRFANGALTGSITIRSTNFPEALHVQSGSITATLTETNDIDLAGEALIMLGPAGQGHLTASRENGVITIGTVITLNNIHGLQSAQFTLVFTSEGKVEGEADIATDETLIPGLSGSVHLTYKDNLWSGETEIHFTKEELSINGTLLVGVRQTEEGTLVFHGSGELSAEVVPGVVGTVGVEIDEDGTVTLNIAFTQTEPWTLFDEQRQEREFLNISRNIPVFAAIVVAVIRLRAGVRAGIGPGQIRNTHVEGTWVITSDAPPDLTVNSEFFMPAFVEGYVAFGAGLGVDVVLGSLTGGIEGVATAGLYGAVSVIPELSYENGDWLFDGTATLAAGARLKLSLNAWAEIEAFWVTVWEESWELASQIMNIGPDLVLRANVAMNLSNPSVPELTFESSDVDADGLINAAMPADGPPSAGTREAIQNRAQWAGHSRAPGAGADSVPPDLAAQANQAPPAPAAPPHPSGHSSPPPPPVPAAPMASPSTASGSPSATGATTAPATTPTPSAGGAAATGTGAPSSASAPHTPTVPAAEIPVTEAPRYPNGISLAMLDEPHVQMPRTAAQERQDLEAAGQVFDLAEAQATDSEQLAGYFERIRVRFQLTSIGYQAHGNEFVVYLAINPQITKKSDVIEKGTGIAGKQTNITYTSGNLSGTSDIVGAEMVADPLGPDHLAGSGPSGQSDLMGRLQTDPSKADDSKYIRGHLLNDRIGGSGDPMNLFPITSAANRLHEQQIESRVKDWVNSDKYWVYYKVTVSVKSVDIDNARRLSTNKVNSELRCKAYVYDLQNKKHNEINATIVSTFKAAAEVQDATGVSRDDEVAVATRPQDRAAAIAQSTRLGSSEYILDSGIFDKIQKAIRNNKPWDLLEQRLTGLAGMGAGRAEALRLIYNKAVNKGVATDLSNDLGPSEKAALTIINGMAGDICRVLTNIR